MIRIALDYGLKHLEDANYQLTKQMPGGILVHLPEALMERACGVEQLTGLSLTGQITTSLTSLCNEAEKHGKLTFPLESSTKKTKQPN